MVHGEYVFPYTCHHYILIRPTALMDSIKADHGFNMDSKSVKNLLQTMSELTIPERRDFLQFTTGSPKLPIGGLFSTLILYFITDKIFRLQESYANVHCGLQA